jgi:phage gpG-like protein
MSGFTIASNAREILTGLRRFPGAMQTGIAAAMDRENQFTIRHLSENKLRQKGPKTLGVVTNRLRSSVRASAAKVSGTLVESGIGSNVVYAAIHEFGGKTKARTIYPRKGKALSFFIGGRAVTVAKVNHPGSKMPARAPFRTSLEERSRNYGESISAAIVAAWEGGRA